MPIKRNYKILHDIRAILVFLIILYHRSHNNNMSHLMVATVLMGVEGMEIKDEDITWWQGSWTLWSVQQVVDVTASCPSMAYVHGLLPHAIIHQ
ncbi:hypothetical protein M5689_001097 [Euphorbia peplus]|nr:hypothetical protein M5689_001097 [Euphorbia peplus]